MKKKICLEGKVAGRLIPYVLSVLILFLSACKREVINNQEQKLNVASPAISNTTSGRLGLSYQEGNNIREPAKEPLYLIEYDYGL
jgi:hypothetical protein